MKITLVAIFAAVVLPGCSERPAPEDSLSEPAGTVSPPELEKNVHLMYLTGTVHTRPDDDGLASIVSEWTVGTYDPTMGTATLAYMSGPQQVGSGPYPAALAPTAYMQPLPDGFLIDSPDALRVAAASLSTGLTAPGPGSMVTYWLSMVEGTPTWQVSMTGPNPEGPVFINALTGEKLNVTPPSPLGFNQALSAALEAGTVGAADSLIEAIASEEPAGGHMMSTMRWTRPPGMFVLPDPVPADGKAPSWLLIFHDWSNDATYPVYVTAGHVPQRGSDLETSMSNEDYREVEISETVLDADAVMASAGVAFPFPLNYVLTRDPRQAEPEWRLDAAAVDGLLLSDVSVGSSIGAVTGLRF